MKLGALKTAIREHPEPKIHVDVQGVCLLSPKVQKGSFMEELDKAFPEGRSQETGLWLSEDGFLMRESSRNQTD